MKPSFISADELFQFHRKALKWEWVAGQQAKERHFDEVAVRAARSAADLVGYLNYIHPYRVQILGEREAAYVGSATDKDAERRLSRIVDLEPPALVLCDGIAPSDSLRHRRTASLFVASFC
jgi:HPr kinase/phosphorylase